MIIFFMTRSPFGLLLQAIAGGGLVRGPPLPVDFLKEVWVSAERNECSRCYSLAVAH